MRRRFRGEDPRAGTAGIRVIGGRLRGRKIDYPGGNVMRPTKDRVRESVFDIIRPDVPEAVVLDLFSGSGAYAFEALSGGAEEAVLVERDPRCVESIRKNIEALGLAREASLIEGDVFSVIPMLSEGKRKFDIVFADPPYNTEAGKKTLIMVNQYDILNPLGLLIVEHSVREVLSAGEGDVSVFKQKTYGDISISIFRRR